MFNIAYVYEYYEKIKVMLVEKVIRKKMSKTFKEYSSNGKI